MNDKTVENPLMTITNSSGTATASGTDTSMSLVNRALGYRRPLMGYFAKRIRDQTEVEDLVQEVFLRLFQRNLDEPVERIEQYLFQTAANVLTDRHRRRSVRGLDQWQEISEADMPVSEASPEDILISQETLQQFIKTLNNLPERTRDIFVLRVFEGYKLADISVQMNITERAVQKHMARSLKLLITVFGVEK